MEDSVFKRVLLLYGAYVLVHNAVYVFSYYLLPTGLLRGASPTASVAAAPSSSGGQFALTVLFNLGMVAAVGAGLNLVCVRQMPLGYLIPVAAGIMTGLVLGTDSFVYAGAMQVPLREGLALGYVTGELEVLGYVCIVAATAGISIYRYDSWRQLRGTKTRRLKDVRLTGAEAVVLVLGAVFIILGAVVETMIASQLR